MKQKPAPKLLAPIKLTEPQRNWLIEEQQRTGNSFAVIVRMLIQDKINK